MKKLISLLLAMLLVISLVACQVPQDDPAENPSDSPADDTPPETPAADLFAPFLNHRITLTENASIQIALAGQDALSWGNVLDLSADDLGISRLSLSPAMLLFTEDGTAFKEKFLLLGTQTALPGVYRPDIQRFLINSGLGVRALGLAYSVTDREKDYKNASNLAADLSVKAKNAAILSMNTYGSTLAAIVVKKATEPDSLYASANIDALKSMVNGLTAPEGALAYIEQAYIQYILGYVAGAAIQNGVDAGKDDKDGAWYLIHTIVEGEDASLERVKATLETAGVTLPTDLAERIAAFERTKDSVLSAQAKLNAMEIKAEYTWADISSAVLGLANVDAIEINGYAAGDAMQHMNDILTSMMSNGLNVTTRTGGGVYADIADHCGDYKTNVIVEEIPYGGLVLTNVTASMQVTSLVQEPNLLSCAAVIEAVGAPFGSNTLRENSIRAYTFDFVLRASAEDTPVYLQTGPVSLSENGTSLLAQSTVAFTSDTLNSATIQSMIEYVRVVFFDTQTLEVFATAKPDTAGAYVADMGLIAGLQIADDGSATPIVTLPKNETVNVSALIYVDVAALDDGKLSYDAFALLNSAVQLQFSNTAE